MATCPAPVVPVDLPALIRTCLANLKPQAAKRGIRFDEALNVLAHEWNTFGFFLGTASFVLLVEQPDKHHHTECLWQYFLLIGYFKLGMIFVPALIIIGSLLIWLRL